ncbi:hypothetical protein ACLOJK_041855 [Asimina triloba]
MAFSRWPGHDGPPAVRHSLLNSVSASPNASPSYRMVQGARRRGLHVRDASAHGGDCRCLFQMWVVGWIDCGMGGWDEAAGSGHGQIWALFGVRRRMMDGALAVVGERDKGVGWRWQWVAMADVGWVSMEHGDGLLAIGSRCLRWFGDGLGVMDRSGQRDGGGLLLTVAHGRGRWLIWVRMGADSFAWRSVGVGLLAVAVAVWSDGVMGDDCRSAVDDWLGTSPLSSGLWILLPMLSLSFWTAPISCRGLRRKTHGCRLEEDDGAPNSVLLRYTQICVHAV